MSDNLPRVAVLLAAYNGMAWIEAQVASILAQTGVSVTLYISIDTSVDGTEVWCAELARLNSNICVLPPAGPFGGAAPNFFRLIRDVDFLAFDYVAFADQDDLWYQDKLDRAVSKLRVCDVDGYSSNVVAFWSNGRRVLVNKAQPQVKWDYFFEAAGPGCTYVLTQRLARAFKSALNEHWHKVQAVTLHDWLCYAYARSAGFKWYIDPIPGMDYRQHVNNQVGVNAGIASAILRVRQVWQGWWFTQVRLICELTAGKNSQNTVAKILARSGRFSLFRLMIHARECRRRYRDQLVFAAFCGLLAFRRR